MALRDEIYKKDMELLHKQREILFYRWDKWGGDSLLIKNGVAFSDQPWQFHIIIKAITNEMCAR